MIVLTPAEISKTGISLSLGSLAVNIPKGEIDALGSMGEWVASDGELIVQEGTYQKHLYTILDGEVDVFKKNADTKQILIRLSSGTLFGEISLLSGGQASANVEAAGKAILWRINHKHLMEFVEGYSSGGQICINLAKVLSDRLVQANEKIVDLASKT